MCKECGGASICEHGRQRYYCKECGARASASTGGCEGRARSAGPEHLRHGRERYKCKVRGFVICDTGGSDTSAWSVGGICEHGRHRRFCKECGGSGFCEHGRQRSLCKECGGSQICEHGRQRYYCKECGGAGICEHGRQRPQCKECGGSQICEHRRRKYGCKECRAAREAATRVLCPVHPEPEILVESRTWRTRARRTQWQRKETLCLPW